MSLRVGAGPGVFGGQNGQSLNVASGPDLDSAGMDRSIHSLARPGGERAAA